MPQCTGIIVPPPRSSNAFNAFSGPRWIVPHAAFHAPTSSIVRSKRPKRSRIWANSWVSPVSPEKNTLRFAVSITHVDHSVALRPVRRPLKCCPGVAVNASELPGSVYVSHQSSSCTSSGATPNASRYWPTPSDVTIGTRSLASCSIVGLHM